MFGERVCTLVVSQSAGDNTRGLEDVLCSTLKFCKYAYSVFALNLTRDMGTSSAQLSVFVSGKQMQSRSYRICCRRPGIVLRCSTRQCEFSCLEVAAPQLSGADETYPVPHCSTLVMLSWRRLFNQATSSCLKKGSCQPYALAGAADADNAVSGCQRPSDDMPYLDSPIVASYVLSVGRGLQRRGDGRMGMR